MTQGTATVVSVAMLAVLVATNPALAARERTAPIRIEIRSQDLGDALDRLAAQTGIQMLYDPQLVRGKRAQAIAGQYRPADALAVLLRGTGLGYRESTRGVLVIVPLNALTSAGAMDTVRRADARPAADEVRRDEIAAAEYGAEQTADIVVTANKRRERLQNVPASITVQTGESLARRGATELSDLIATTPGLYNPAVGGGITHNLVMRGVTTGTGAGLQQSTVSLLLDDIEVDPAGGFLLRTNLKIVDVERIEVLRGPQGTLFGSGSLSGAVRFISNKPDLGRFSGSVLASASTTRDGDETLTGTAVLNLPIIADKLGIRLVGYAHDTGGWVDNRFYNRTDVNGDRTLGGRLMISARPTETLSLLFSAMHQDIDQHGDGRSFYAAQPGIADWRREGAPGSGNTADLKSTILNFTGTYDAGFGTVTASSSYLDRKSLLVQDSAYYLRIIGPLLGMPNLSGDVPGSLDFSGEVFTQELRISSRTNAPLRWTLGGYYQTVDGTGEQRITADVLRPFLGTDLIASIASDTKQTQIAAFGELTYTIADTIDLTAGLRYGQSKLDFDTRSAGLAATGNPNPAFIVASKGRHKQDAANPRFAIAYRPNADLTFYVQAARGFRTGGPNPTAALGGGGVPAAYGSDSLWNYEIGHKARLFDGKLQLSLAAYQIDWRNIQVSLSTNNVAYTGNAGQAKVQGIEGEIVGRPLSWLELGGTFSANRSKLTRNIPDLVRITGLRGVFAGERLPASPELQLSFYGQGSFDLWGRNAFVRASHQYVGKAYTDFGEKGFAFGDYHVVDLRAGVDLGGVELAGFVSNLFDGDGMASAADPVKSGPLTLLPALAVRVRPRTAGLSLNARF